MPKAPSRQKKAPSDYPVFGFRVPGDKESGASPAAVKDRLNAAIGRVQRHYKGKDGSDGYAWTRNRIIVRALELGLDQMVRKKP